MKQDLKIAIIGYGKMGREIEKHALAQNIKVVAKVDNEQDWNTYQSEISSADVAIEFTAPEIVTGNLKRLFDLGIPVVTGSTGWYDEFDQIKTWCEKSNGSLFYATNFSIGVNLFFALNRHLAKLMNDYPHYQIFAEESHHTQKLDAPSGTAITLLEEILQNHDGYKNWKLIPGETTSDEIPVIAHREEGVTGTHIIRYESEIDTIEIKHTANNRAGFAKGAIAAAQWLIGKKGVFTMKHLMNL
jgi:4-hydroxy-tetrahydrodipicolinate reductase